MTACHPGTAREALRDFAVSFGAITHSARDLRRTTSTMELADLLIDAANAEEAAFRQLRDRWQPGNISLLEAVEVKRAEAGRAQNEVADLSFQLQDEFEEGPTADEVAEMEEFSKTFDDIADAWDDFHDDYSTLVKKERRLEAEAGVAGYAQLIEQFSKIVSEIGELTPTDTSEELIETLQDAAEIELEELEYLAESLSEPPDPKSADTPVPTPAPAARTSSEESTQVVTEGVPEASAGDPDASDGPQEMELSPAEEFSAAIEESVAALEAVENSIEEIVNDKSAENLEDLKGFGRAVPGVCP